MKLNRTDAASLAVIVCGALVAVGLTGLVAERGHQERHEIQIEVTEERATIKETTVRIDAGVRVIRSEDADASSGPQPLIYVDGVRMEGDRESVLADISPDDIDRIEVVKGEAAMRLFGEEATGGVIQIFLKDIGSAHPGG